MIDQGLHGYVCGRRVSLRGYRIEQNSLDGWQITPPFPLAADSELRIYCNGAHLATLVGSYQDEAWDFERFLKRLGEPQHFREVNGALVRDTPPPWAGRSAAELVQAMDAFGQTVNDARERIARARLEFAGVTSSKPITAITGLTV